MLRARLAVTALACALAAGCNPDRISIGGNDLVANSSTGSGGSAGTAGFAGGTGPAGAGTGGRFDPDARYVVMMSPTSGESFTDPATLSLVAAARDPNVNDDVPAKAGNAARVEFFVDDQSVASVEGSEAEYWVFSGISSPLVAGAHRVWARASYVNPDATLDSAPVSIVVEAPPAYAETIDLDANVMLGPDEDFGLVGSAEGRVRLNGHGFGIYGPPSATGAFTLQFVDAFDLGNAVQAQRESFSVYTSGAITIENCRFDTSNPITLNSIDGSVSIRHNTFRSNMRWGAHPNDPIGSGESPTLLNLGGFTLSDKVFAANNVAAGAVVLHGSNWVIGGDTDDDGNVLIGARVGFTITGSTEVAVRRNYSHDVYYGGWTDARNVGFQGSAITVEHNVFFGGPTPVDGTAGAELRYNLVLDAGQQWVIASPGSTLDHNVFIGGENTRGGLDVFNDPENPDAVTLDVTNNTFDALFEPRALGMVRMEASSGPVNLSSNAFIHLPGVQTVMLAGGVLSADYNGFFGSPLGAYSDGRSPAHDLSGADAELMDPSSVQFDLDEKAIWERTTTTAAILRLYRMRYMPKPGSALLGAGDPALAPGNSVGAVGNGDPSDHFGDP